MAWLTPWKYRKTITVTGASANYQTKILVAKTSAASGEDVDCDGYVADDFDDLRFTGADGTTLLDYWIESIADSGGTKLATVWVQNNAGADATLYMYYGGTETAVSSGANTFEAEKWDNFEWGADTNPITDSGGNITGWLINAGDVDISTEQEYTGIAADTRSMKLIGGATVPQSYFAKAVGTDYAIRFRFFKETAASSYLLTHGNGTKRVMLYIDASENVYYYDGALKDTGVDITADIWQLLEVNNLNWTAYTYDLVVNGGVPITGLGMAASVYQNGQVFFSGDGVAGRDYWIDNVIVRKWAAVEQTFAFGSKTFYWTHISHDKGTVASSVSHKKGIAVTSISHVKGIAV